MSSVPYRNAVRYHGVSSLSHGMVVQHDIRACAFGVAVEGTTAVSTSEITAERVLSEDHCHISMNHSGMPARPAPIMLVYHWCGRLHCVQRFRLLLPLPAVIGTVRRHAARTIEGDKPMFLVWWLHNPRACASSWHIMSFAA